jgi:antitoxin MazE
MTTTIGNWGNNLGLRLPRNLARRSRLTLGTEVKLEIVDGGILIKPIGRRKGRTLKQMLAERKAGHVGEFWKDDPVGREII